MTRRGQRARRRARSVSGSRAAAAVRAPASRAVSTSSGVGSNGSTACATSARLARVLVVDAAAHEHDRVDAQRALVLRQRLAEDEDLDRALEVVERREHHRGRPSSCGSSWPAVMMPPAVTQSPSLRSARSASGQSTCSAQRLAHLLERVRGDEEADRLLLDGQQLGLVELLGRDRRVLRRGERRRRAALGAPASARRGRRSSPGRSAASCWVFWPGALGLLEHARACPCATRRWSRTRRT